MAHQNEDEIFIEIHEVHYDDDIPKMYSENAATIGGESIEEILWSLKKMGECLIKPIIWAGERFPEIYISD